jgi:hypothetical protein
VAVEVQTLVTLAVQVVLAVVVLEQEAHLLMEIQELQILAVVVEAEVEVLAVQLEQRVVRVLSLLVIYLLHKKHQAVILL